MVDGSPSKNPRYLQKRPDLMNPRDTYLAEIGTRLAREIPSGSPVHFPVNAVLAGRRNNPPDPKTGVPPLAVYNPIHYQELPELFMDFICSLTGKSPSTTGFGSEGALTKGPFNALSPVVGCQQRAGVGDPDRLSRFHHGGRPHRTRNTKWITTTACWSRNSGAACESTNAMPDFLIENGYLEKVEDFEYEGRKVQASRLGYRITASFVDRFLGRIFEMPSAVFPEDLLRPEKQDLAAFVAGMDAIVEAQKSVALIYFEDGSVEAACPPIKALLHIMAHGEYEGMRECDPSLRAMFTRDSLLKSDWYKERLRAKQAVDIALWKRHKAAQDTPQTRERLEQVSSEKYLTELVGTIGADPSLRYTDAK